MRDTWKDPGPLHRRSPTPPDLESCLPSKIHPAQSQAFNPSGCYNGINTRAMLLLRRLSDSPYGVMRGLTSRYTEMTETTTNKFSQS